jgi:hypothetical protein
MSEEEEEEVPSPLPWCNENDQKIWAVFPKVIRSFTSHSSFCKTGVAFI